MEVKQGYKQTEAGVIPEDWDVKPLRELCAQNGLVRGPFGSSLRKEFFVESGIKVYEQKNAIDKSVEIGSYFIDSLKFSELRRFEVFEGDFVVSCSGTIGKIFQIPHGAPRGIINQALLKIKTDDKVVDSRYFILYFDWAKFQERIIDYTQGGAMKNLVGMPIFKNTSIAVPRTKTEQTAIATALSDTDTLINSLEKLIAKKRNIRKGAMQLLLTGKKRLPGFSGEWDNLNMAEKSILKARIGWQGLTTAEYLESGHYYLVTGTDFQNGCINWSSCWFVDRNRYMQDTNIQLKVKDVLLTKDGTIGKVGYVDSLPGPATLNSGVFVIRPKNNAYNPLYFYYVLDSHIFSDFLAKLQAGSTISHLYQKDFVNFNFMAPELAEQTAIARVLSDMDAEIEQLERKLAKYKMIKQGMMQELLTGKKRLI